MHGTAPGTFRRPSGVTWCAVTALAFFVLPALAGEIGPATLLNPTVNRPGYSIRLISVSVPASVISKMTFKAGDLTHLYVVQESGSVLRYDYDPVDGDLSNAVTIASGMAQALGLAFHGNDLFESPWAFNASSSTIQPPPRTATRRG